MVTTVITHLTNTLIVPPLPSNVLFEDGIFNSDRMANNFDWLNNSWLCYPQAGFRGGNMAARGGGASGHLNTGEVIIVTGSNAVDATIENKLLCHTGNTNDAELSGRAYYIPLNMQSLQSEGYTKLKFTAGVSGYGIPGAPVSGQLIVDLLGAQGTTQMYSLNSRTISEQGNFDPHPTLQTYEINLANYQEYIPIYLCFEFVVGTSNIKKVWFE